MIFFDSCCNIGSVRVPGGGQLLAAVQLPGLLLGAGQRGRGVQGGLPAGEWGEGVRVGAGAGGQPGARPPPRHQAEVLQRTHSDLLHCPVCRTNKRDNGRAGFRCEVSCCPTHSLIQAQSDVGPGNLGSVLAHQYSFISFQ